MQFVPIFYSYYPVDLRPFATCVYSFRRYFVDKHFPLLPTPKLFFFVIILIFPQYTQRNSPWVWRKNSSIF